MHQWIHVAIVGLPTVLAGQLPPVRPIGPVVATAADQFYAVMPIRPLSDGRVLIQDDAHKQLIILDSMLTRRTVAWDDPAGTLFRAIGTLIAWPGDSTLVPDTKSGSLALLDPDGRLVRRISFPHPRDATLVASLADGFPALDRDGRLIYRGVFQPRPPTVPQPPADSTPLVRADLKTGVVDTIAVIQGSGMPSSGRGGVDANGNAILIRNLGVFSPWDEYAVLPNGTVSVIRNKDYHVEWIEPDGTRRASSPVSWPWKPLTAVEKQHLIDSVKVLAARADSIRSAQYPTGIRQVSEVVRPGDMSDFRPPFDRMMTRVDADGRIWAREALPDGSKADPIYDIIDRTGQIVDRVQLPAGRIAWAFGPHGAVYLVSGTLNKMILERAVYAPPRP